MKSVITEKSRLNKDVHFPILMKNIDSDLIVLFTKELIGVVVNENPIWPIGLNGVFASCFDGDVWVYYTGSITLSND